MKQQENYILLYLLQKLNAYVKTFLTKTIPDPDGFTGEFTI